MAAWWRYHRVMAVPRHEIMPAFLSHAALPTRYTRCVLRYRIHYAGDYVKVGRQTDNVVIKNLRSGRLFKFAVCACNTHGYGRPSHASEPVRTLLDKPDAPEGVYIPTVTATSVTIQVSHDATQVALLL